MIEATQRKNILFQYLSFQFFDVPQNILKAWKNYLKFYLNYFSVPLLIKTFFSHWHKYQWFYPKGFDFGKYLETFASNLISRILGVFFRIFLIIAGILVEVFILFAGFFIFLGWLALPLILILSFYHGFRILF